MTQKKTVTRREMPVKGGVAWTETVCYRKRKPQRVKWKEMCSDGVIRTKRAVYFMKGTQTGDCPECKQMPCCHTAKLLGWT